MTTSSRLVARAFDVALAPLRALAFHEVLLAGVPARSKLPVLVVANHVSWWDGFLLRELQRTAQPKARPHAVMLERELRLRPPLRLVGAYGVEPGDAMSTRRVLRRLEAARRRLDSDFWLFWFPQGRIWPAHRRPLGFERGIELAIRRLAPIRVLPVAIDVEPLNRRRPTALLSAGEPVDVWPGARPRREELEEMVTNELELLRRVAARWGEDLPTRWPREAKGRIG